MAEEESEYLFELLGNDMKLGEIAATGKTIGEAFAKARQVARDNRFITSIKHGRGIYNL